MLFQATEPDKILEGWGMLIRMSLSQISQDSLRRVESRIDLLKHRNI